MLLFQFGFAQADFSKLDAILKNNEKLLGKEYALVIQKDGKNIKSSIKHACKKGI
jgi:hypothetical protein